MEVEDAAIDSMGAYLEAMRGEDGHTRDAKGKVRFNKTQGKRGRGGEEEDEGLVTEGLKELEVAPGRNKKKLKRETVKIGAEFKAKVSSFDIESSRTILLISIILNSTLVETLRRMECSPTLMFLFKVSLVRGDRRVVRVLSSILRDMARKERSPNRGIWITPCITRRLWSWIFLY